MLIQETNIKSQEEQLLAAVREIVDQTDSIHEISTKIVKNIVTPTPETELTKTYQALSRPENGQNMRIDIIVNTAIAIEDWYQGDEVTRAKMPSKSDLLCKLFETLGTA